ncbi:MAG TPA: MoaD/ThiS family protein [Casimicrobiaceae bacterium]|nr:MoaD/ThiS family protein [Casimicrobiaceae bacterium]
MSETAALTVRIPGLLRSYTRGASEVALERELRTLDDALRELDRRYPGLRFRIVDEQHRVRQHIKLFVDARLVRDLATPITDARELMIVGALSGG